MKATLAYQGTVFCKPAMAVLLNYLNVFISYFSCHLQRKLYIHRIFYHILYATS